MSIFARRSGFTLIELLLVIAIMILLAGVGALSLFNVRGRHLVESERLRLETVLRKAQLNAITQLDAVDWGVHLDTSGQNGAHFFRFFFNSVSPNVVQLVYFDNRVHMNPPQNGDIVFSKVTGLPMLQNGLAFTADGYLDVTLQEQQTQQTAVLRIYQNGLIAEQ